MDKDKTLRRYLILKVISSNNSKYTPYKIRDEIFKIGFSIHEKVIYRIINRMVSKKSLLYSNGIRKNSKFISITPKGLYELTRLETHKELVDIWNKKKSEYDKEINESREAIKSLKYEHHINNRKSFNSKYTWRDIKNNRIKAEELIGNKCIICNSSGSHKGKRRGVIFHEIHGIKHLYGYQDGGKYYLENSKDFVSMCYTHHKSMHDFYNWTRTLTDEQFEKLLYYLKLLRINK